MNFKKIKEFVLRKNWLEPILGGILFIVIFLFASLGEPLDAFSRNGEKVLENTTLDDDTSNDFRTAETVGSTPAASIKDQWIHNQIGSMYISNGKYMKNQWLILDGITYYLGEDGSRAHSITKIGEDIYYFNYHGQLLTDTLVDGSYLIDTDGKVLTGYRWIENQQYFFQNDGQMLKGTATPDGIYNVNGDGVITSVNMEKSKAYCPLSDSPGTSGYKIGAYPVELYMLSMAGETSGGNIINGDKGRAYGLCQLDYRYDLMDFINYAYETHPYLWVGLKDVAGHYEKGDEALVSNDTITRGFALADQLSKVNYAVDQTTFLYSRYFSNTYNKLQAAGYNLVGRHISVSAALMSININCGVQTELYLSKLSPEMTDEAILQTLYALRNGILTEGGKGSNTRFRTSEPQLAMDMLSGKVTAASTLYYGGGVTWSKSTLTYCGETISEKKIAARLATLGHGITVGLDVIVASPSDAAAVVTEASISEAGTSGAETTEVETTDMKEQGPGIKPTES